MNNRLQQTLKHVLLAFVLITIGFALGKEVTLRRLATAGGETSPADIRQSESSSTARAIVYYAHGTLRCVTCNTIEALAGETVENRFAAEVAEGTVVWQVVNFQEDEAFAERYDIVSSCVVVVGMQGNEETGYRRLDEVWTKVDDPPAFQAYVAQAIRQFLPGSAGAAP